MSSVPPLSEDDLHDLYLWVDEIPLSRPKRCIARDFSDGVCVAEIVKHFFPKLVELHNYTPANSTPQKITNWNTLNTRVFRKLHFEVPIEEIRDITTAVPGAIERFLRALRIKVNQIRGKQQGRTSAPASQQRQRSVAAAESAPRASGRPHSAAPHEQQSSTSAAISRQVAEEKEQTINELRETVSLLNEKVSKLEELIRVKDAKISALMQQLQHQHRR